MSGMSLLGNLFGRRAPRPLGELRQVVGELFATGRYRQGLQELDAHRHAVDRHYEGDEAEQLYQNGVAHYLALAPLLQAAKDQHGEEQYSTLRAFYASYVAMHITLGRVKDRVSSDRRVLIEQHMQEGSDLYDGSYASLDEEICDAADTEANEIISSGLRQSGIL